MTDGIPINLRVIDENGQWRDATSEEANAEWVEIQRELMEQAEADFYDDALNAYVETHGHMHPSRHKF